MERIRKKELGKKSAYWQLCVTACLGAVLFLILCAVRDLFPIGDGSVLMIDLHSQYTPLLYRFFDVVTGEKNLFMDFHVSGGANLYADTINELINPFNYLLLFFGRDRIWLAINVLLGTYVIAAAVSMHFFLLRQWPQKRQWNVALSLAYGFSGFAAYQFQIIKWMIFPVIFPFFVLALKQLIEEKKGGWYAVLLAYQLMLNLQLGAMSLLATLFGSGLYFFFCMEKEEKKQAMCRLAWYTILGAAGSAAVLWPGMRYLLSSARGGENSSYFAVMKQHGLDDLFERLFLTVHPVMLGMFLFCAGKRIANHKKGKNSWKTMDRQGKFLIAWNFFLFVTVLAQPSNLLWHLGSYMCFPVRYAYIVLVAEICFLKWQQTEYGEDEEAEEKNRVLRGWQLGSELTAVMLCVGALYLTLREADQITQAFSTLAISRVCPDQTLLVGLILGMLTAAALLALFAGKRKQFAMLVVSFVSSLCLFLCVLLPQDYAVRLMNEDAYKAMNETAGRKESQEEIEEAAQNVGKGNNAGTEGFSRVPDDEDLPLNAALIIGHSTLTGYFPAGSQMVYAEGMEQLGYLTPWVSTRSWGGTMISDGILGVKKEETAAVSGKALVLEESAEVLAGESKKAAAEAPLALQMYIGEAISGRKILERLSGETLVLRIDDERAVYLDTGIPAASLTVLVNGEKVEIPESGSWEGPDRLLYLGTFSREEVQIQILDQNGTLLSDGAMGNGSAAAEAIELGLVDTAAWKQALEDAVSLDISLDHRGGSMQINVSQAAAGKTIFVPAASIDGWQCMADGEAVEIMPIFGGFMGITLPENVSTLEFTFCPPGLKVGMAVSLTAVFLLILCSPWCLRWIRRLSCTKKGPLPGEHAGKWMSDRVVSFMANCYRIVWIAGILLIYVVPDVGMVCYMIYRILAR